MCEKLKFFAFSKGGEDITELNREELEQEKQCLEAMIEADLSSIRAERSQLKVVNMLLKEKTMNKMYELNDYKVHSFDKITSNKIFELATIKECKFCHTKLDPNKADYYKHSGGWQTSIIKNKIWIWFSCPKCRHEWSINHLGILRKNIIQL